MKHHRFAFTDSPPATIMSKPRSPARRRVRRPPQTQPRAEPRASKQKSERPPVHASGISRAGKSSRKEARLNKEERVKRARKSDGPLRSASLARHRTRRRSEIGGQRRRAASEWRRGRGGAQKERDERNRVLHPMSRRNGRPSRDEDGATGSPLRHFIYCVRAAIGLLCPFSLPRGARTRPRSPGLMRASLGRGRGVNQRGIARAEVQMSRCA